MFFLILTKLIFLKIIKLLILLYLIDFLILKGYPYDSEEEFIMDSKDFFNKYFSKNKEN